MRGSSKNTETPNFHIPNKNLKLKKEIINIASHKGVSYSQFLRQEIIRIRDSYPEHQRNKNAQDD
jgi:hypothetical protein